MRYLIKFTKESDIKFISHLDLMRTVQKIIKRSGLPIEYSKGFNPHMSLSFAQPLAVGVYSSGEYMDIVLTEDLEADEVRKNLNNSCPMGVKILDVMPLVQKGEKKIPKSMAAIEGARYVMKIKYAESGSLENEMENLLSMDSWVTVKKTKTSEKESDIKPLVKELKYQVAGDELIMDAIISCGSKENLSADLLAGFISDNTTGARKDAFVDVKREELYGFTGKKLIPLNEYLRRFCR